MPYGNILLALRNLKQSERIKIFSEFANDFETIYLNQIVNESKQASPLTPAQIALIENRLKKIDSGNETFKPLSEIKQKFSK